VYSGVVLLASLGTESCSGTISLRPTTPNAVLVRREAIGQSHRIGPQVHRWVAGVRGWILHQLSVEQVRQLEFELLRGLNGQTMRHLRHVEALSAEQWEQIPTSAVWGLSPNQLRRLLTKAPERLQGLQERLSVAQQWLLEKWHG
jgi:hypothetical protein